MPTSDLIHFPHFIKEETEMILPLRASPLPLPPRVTQLFLDTTRLVTLCKESPEEKKKKKKESPEVQAHISKCLVTLQMYSFGFEGSLNLS